MQTTANQTPEAALAELQKTVASSLGSSDRRSALPRKRRPRVAFEVTPESIRAVAIDSRAASPRLEKLHLVFAPDELRNDPVPRSRFLGQEIKRYLRSRGARNFVCVLPPGSVRSSIVTLPAMDKADELSALSMKLMKLISGSPDHWVCDVTRISTAEDDSSANHRFLLSAVPRVQIEELAEVLAAAGRLPCAITTASATFPELARVDESDESGLENDGFEEEDAAAWVVVQIRRRKTAIHIYRHGVLEYSREVEWGGRDLTAALTDVVATPEGFIELTEDEAEQIKKIVGIPAEESEEPVTPDTRLNASQVRMMLHPKLNTLVFELRNSIRYYQQSSGCRRLERLTLTGGGSRLPGLDDYIHQQLKIRPHRFTGEDAHLSCAHLSLEDQQQLFGHGAHLIAALQARRFPNDLAPMPLRAERLLRRPFRVAMTVATAGILTCLLLALKVENSLASAEGPDPSQPESVGYEQARDALERRSVTIEQQIDDLQRLAGYRAPVPDLIAELARRTPDGVRLRRLSLENRRGETRLKLQGNIQESATQIEQPSVILRKAYRGSPFIASLEIESLNRQEAKERFQFTLHLVPYLIESVAPVREHGSIEPSIPSEPAGSDNPSGAAPSGVAPSGATPFGATPFGANEPANTIKEDQ